MAAPEDIQASKLLTAVIQALIPVYDPVRNDTTFTNLL